jgi:hypothetical protein
VKSGRCAAEGPAREDIEVRVILIETEGRGGVAEIELDDQRLRVVDAVSPAERPASPGPIANPKLEVVVNPHLTRRAAAGSSATGVFEADHGWRYRAHGEIVSTRPLRADLGCLRLELDRADADDWSVGDRISVAIDCIILTCEGG